MAQRKVQQGQLAPRPRVAARSKSEPEKPDAVRRERDALRAELAAAKAEIERLSEVQAQVLNRIDWIIDSLNSLSDDAP